MLGTEAATAASTLLNSAVMVMNKVKSHKGSQKRFKVSANGKLKRRKAGKSHLNSHKSGKRKRKLRKPAATTDGNSKRYVKILEG